MRYTNATRSRERRASADEFVIGPSMNGKPNLHTVLSLAPLFGCTSASPRIAILASVSLEFGGGESKTVPRFSLPPKNYTWNLFQGRITTSSARPFGASFRLRLGEYYGGTRSDYRGELSWRPSRYFTATTSYELRQLRLRAGDFDVRIASAAIKIALTPDLTWNTVAQYDNISRQVGLNSRIRWTWRPGDDLYFVVNQGWDFDDGRFSRSQSDIVLKAAATFRY